MYNTLHSRKAWILMIINKNEILKHQRISFSIIYIFIAELYFFIYYCFRYEMFYAHDDKNISNTIHCTFYHRQILCWMLVNMGVNKLNLNCKWNRHQEDNLILFTTKLLIIHSLLPIGFTSFNELNWKSDFMFFFETVANLECYCFVFFYTLAYF